MNVPYKSQGHIQPESGSENEMDAIAVEGFIVLRLVPPIQTLHRRQIAFDQT